MIHHLRGTLTELTPAFAVLEAAGVGYKVNISLQTYSALAGAREALLYTHPIYKEDDQTLFGFANTYEREIFARLLSVSGVGGNTARVILSSLTADEVVQAISGENVSLLKSIKGIGAKTAQRIIVDLKDKVGGIAAGEPVAAGGSSANAKAEAASALEVLGYSPRQVEPLLRKLLKEQPEMKLEDLIKEALKRL